jgi:transcriptional regulator with XRE-family HTH domain
MTSTRPDPSGVPLTPKDLQARCAASPGMVTRFAAAGVILSGVLTSTATGLPASQALPLQPRSMPGRTGWSGNGGSVDELVLVGAVSAPVTARVAEPVTTAELVHRLRAGSGLTGDQLARLFGVSRRAVHLWASGGRINAAHHERLSQLVAVVEGLQGETPEQRRSALLAPGPDGRSLYDRLRSEHGSRDGDILSAPWHPTDLLDDEEGSSAR